jgi:hypothetical protein
VTARRRTAIARVVLTLEPESLRGEAIDTAVRLARAYGAELAAVFVKTADLINMASMPFGATVIGAGGTRRRIDRAELEYRLDRLARDAEALLARSAGGVRWTFRTAIGHTEQVAAGAAGSGDLLAVCSRTARHVAETAAAGALLLLGDGVRRDRPVVALFEGDTAVLAAAAEAARAFGKELVVVLPGGGETARRRRSARGWLERRGLAARLAVAAGAGGGELAAELAALAPGLLVLARAQPAGHAVRHALEAGRSSIPLLLVS